LTADNLKQQGLDPGLQQAEDDEWSVMTEESELQPMQNVMDLTVNKINLQPSSIN
jgi:hypothetical protein